MIKIQKASAAYSAAPSLKIALVGSSGMGKTTWAARAPMPLILLTEGQGLASIHHINPEALVISIKNWDEFVSIWSHILSARTIALANGQVAYETEIPLDNKGAVAQVQFQTVVIDSVTDLQIMAVSKVTSLEVGKEFDVKAESKIAIQAWGRINDVMQRIFTQQRNAPFSTVFLFLAKEKEDDGKRLVFAEMKGGASNSYGQFFNAVGYLHAVRTDSGDLERRIYFAPGSCPLVGSKAAPGWPKYIVNTEEPGKTTLGTLLAYSAPSLIATLPMSEGDDPAILERQAASAPSEQEEEEATPTRRRVRR